MVKNKLREIIAKRNIKQTDLSNITGVTKATISNIVNNKFEPSISVAVKIANYLNIPFEEIFYEEDFLSYVKENYLEYFLNFKERIPYKVVATMVFENDITTEEIIQRIQSIKSLNAKVLSIDRLE
jgi:putative transcriptional regulator